MREELIRKHWGRLSLLDIQEELNIDLYDLLKLAVSLGLKNKKTPNIRRTWTGDEEAFLTDNKLKLSVREASNLLYRSHHATYQRIKLLGLKEMINK